MIPVNEPCITEDDINNLMLCVKSGRISSEGVFVIEFEEKWAKYCGRQFGISVSNGTTALDSAIWSLNLPARSEIIIPTFTIISCASAVIRNGHIPVFVDADPDTWCMNVSKIEEKISNKTMAIMPVHIYGHPVDMDPIIRLSEKYHLKVIEDAAEAHGAEYKNKKCGSFGDVSTFSFYANKLITTGEGGMILTDDKKLAERLKSYRNLCFTNERRFLHYQLGTNYRFTNIQAAIGSSQIDRIEQIVNKKRRIGNLYLNLLSGVPSIQLPVERSWAKNIYWMFGIVLTEDNALNANDLSNALTKAGIQTRPFFLGMHEQPVFFEKYCLKDEKFPVATRLARKGLYLPSGLTLSDENIIYITSAIRKEITSSIH